jgi:hypothetical protein
VLLKWFFPSNKEEQTTNTANVNEVSKNEQFSHSTGILFCIILVIQIQKFRPELGIGAKKATFRPSRSRLFRDHIRFKIYKYTLQLNCLVRMLILCFLYNTATTGLWNTTIKTTSSRFLRLFRFTRLFGLALTGFIFVFFVFLGGL